MNDFDERELKIWREEAELAAAESSHPLARKTAQLMKARVLLRLSEVEPLKDEVGEPIIQKLDKALGDLSSAKEDIETGKHQSAILSFLRGVKEYIDSARDDIEILTYRLKQDAETRIPDYSLEYVNVQLSEAVDSGFMKTAISKMLREMYFISDGKYYVRHNGLHWTCMRANYWEHHSWEQFEQEGWRPVKADHFIVALTKARAGEFE